jgi:DNA-directed RNA polymerase specialized sigma24 family protein
VPPSDTLREEGGLTPLAFSRLLEWLDAGVDSRGETYVEMRRRLVSYFERRHRPTAEELADETLNRVGRTLETAGTIVITPPARYCYVVARFVLLEDLRRSPRYVVLDDRREPSSVREDATHVDEALVIREERFACLERCLLMLKPDQRDLAIEYYRDSQRERIERRRALAERLGITMNALALRASRIRNTLEACVESCRRARRQL